ncbi:uncharacterized protein si:rp71-1c10.7 [Acipenser ruthenus]|uniref:uncharacterized protein si:rp71-1c10.7 n=1 Tax=Acipenser ruthenus TaxID=7906 RepID=UPI0027428379|nr:uncharacterized protein si:rp71-1c10.7 [Acipenser ruthenus]
MDMKLFPWFLLLLVFVVSAQKQNYSQKCKQGEFWNADAVACIDCSICQTHPKTPSCDTCEQAPAPTFNVWMVVALVSLSLVVVITTVAVGMYVRQWREKRSTFLSEPVEETAGPLYPGP